MKSAAIFLTLLLSSVLQAQQTLDTKIATLPIDENRIYLTGTSMGGYGTWMWASSNPQHFAAVAPLCGGLGEGGPKDITPNLDRWAKNLATLLLWAFHGGKDTVVPPDRSERMVRAIKDNGSRDVKLTVYPELGHGIAKATYTDAAFYEWLFKWRNDARPIGDSASVERPAPGTFLTFDHNKVERKYLLHLPKGLPNNAPLVFLLHGYRGDARDYMGELGMNRVADAHGFAVCYPQGGNDFEGKPHWNARLEISQTDDIGFLSELAAHLQALHKLNPNKTFVSGISNGGFMSYTLVAEKPEVFKAAASVIGTMSGHTWKHREKIRPVPILQISGLDDEVIPYDGSMSPAGGWGGATNQDVIIDFWTKLNRTKTEEVVKISSKTTAYHYKDGVNHNEVWHYKIKGFGHNVPGKREMGINAVEIIWEFFSKF